MTTQPTEREELDEVDEILLHAEGEAIEAHRMNPDEPYYGLSHNAAKAAILAWADQRANKKFEEAKAVMRESALREVYDAFKGMEQAYPEGGRTLSKGEILKWLEYELHIGKGRNG